MNFKVNYSHDNPKYLNQYKFQAFISQNTLHSNSVLFKNVASFCKAEKVRNSLHSATSLSVFSRVLYLSAMGVQLMNGFFLISVGDKLKGVEKNSSSLQHLFLSNHILSL